MIKEFTLTLPDWTLGLLDEYQDKTYTDQSAMKLAIDLARKNVENNTGGPFGSVILNSKGELVSIGVNRVLPSSCSIAHGEMLAIALAQKEKSTYDLSSDGSKMTLFTSAAPCVMCVGGIFWSGIKRVVYAATTSDVEQIIGFDEGPIHPSWIEELKSRNITVEMNLLREEAIEVLTLYSKSKGPMYNAS